MIPAVRRVGPEAAPEVLAIVRAAFAARPPLDPPADALAETAASMARHLEHGGLLATVGDQPAGALVLDPLGPVLYLRRFGVVPGLQHHGIAAALVEAAVASAEGFAELAVLARVELPETVAFWTRRGFVEVGRQPPYVELRRPLAPPVVVEVADGEAMQALGSRLASLLRAGDLVVLTGELGAGKTTLAQGLGAGLGVRGPITSPTFVIARVHPSEVEGPPLVHVDAYRLGGVAELDDLDLDTDLESAVTVVEWGEGLAEALADSRLEVRIERCEPRRVALTGVGPRWAGVSLVAGVGFPA